MTSVLDTIKSTLENNHVNAFVRRLDEEVSNEHTLKQIDKVAKTMQYLGMLITVLTAHGSGAHRLGHFLNQAKWLRLITWAGFLANDLPKLWVKKSDNGNDADEVTLKKSGRQKVEGVQDKDAYVSSLLLSKISFEIGFVLANSLTLINPMKLGFLSKIAGGFGKVAFYSGFVVYAIETQQATKRIATGQNEPGSSDYFRLGNNGFGLFGMVLEADGDGPVSAVLGIASAVSELGELWTGKWPTLRIPDSWKSATPPRAPDPLQQD